jgi:hypothetical protein
MFPAGNVARDRRVDPSSVALGNAAHVADPQVEGPRFSTETLRRQRRFTSRQHPRHAGLSPCLIGTREQD